MRKLVMVAAFAATAMVLAGCEKTGENEFEVQRPTVGTTTDTVRIPDIDVNIDTRGGDVKVDTTRRDTTKTDTTKRTKTP